MPLLSVEQARTAEVTPLRWLGVAGEARLAERLEAVSARWRGGWADPLARGTPCASLRRGSPPATVLATGASSSDVAVRRELCDRQGAVLMSLSAETGSLEAWLAVEPSTAPAAGPSVGPIAAAVLGEMGDSLLRALGEDAALEAVSVRAAAAPVSAGQSIGARGWWATLALRVDGAARAPLYIGLAPGVVDRRVPRPTRPLPAATAVPRRAVLREHTVAVEVLIGRCRASSQDLRAVARGDVLLFDPDDGGAGELRRRTSDRLLGSVSVGASDGRWAARIEAWGPGRSDVSGTV